MNQPTEPIPGDAAHRDAAHVPATGAPAARAGQTEAELGRAHEAGLNTDSRGGIGSAARAGETETDGAPPGDDGPSTQPRDDTRIGVHSSQGLAGAQGSGGDAERGPRPLK